MDIVKKGDVVSPRALKHIQELEKLKLEKGDKLRAIILLYDPEE